MTETGDFEYDVFISYSHNINFDQIRAIVQQLEHRGLSVWLDDKRIPYGESFFKEIVLGVERSKTVVCIISKKYLESDWCKGELLLGKAFGSFIPLLTKEVSYSDLPFKIDAELCGSFDDLFSEEQNSAALKRLTKARTNFLKNVVDKVTTRTRRTGFDGRELPNVSGGPVHTLKAMRRLPFMPLRANKIKQNLTLAHDTFSNHKIEEVRRAYATFSHPELLHVGLVKMRSVLEVEAVAPKYWKALGDLANPFSPQVASYAFYKAKFSQKELFQEVAFQESDCERLSESFQICEDDYVEKELPQAWMLGWNDSEEIRTTQSNHSKVTVKNRRKELPINWLERLLLLFCLPVFVLVVASLAFIWGTKVVSCGC